MEGKERQNGDGSWYVMVRRGHISEWANLLTFSLLCVCPRRGESSGRMRMIVGVGVGMGIVIRRGETGLRGGISRMLPGEAPLGAVVVEANADLRSACALQCNTVKSHAMKCHAVRCSTMTLPDAVYRYAYPIYSRAKSKFLIERSD